MTAKRKQLICGLLKGIETGDPASAAVVNEQQYIQHNPQTREGGEGLAALFKRLSKLNPSVNIVRIFSDGDFVFGHIEYDFDTPRVGFEIFRFEGDKTVEHWDNIQQRMGPNPAGHSMVDGARQAKDLALTDDNRALIRKFVNEVLIQREHNKIADYINASAYTEHNPELTDNLDTLHDALSTQQDLRYEKLHHLLAEGNFVLSVCEGYRNNINTSFFDLFRIDNNRIVEHWDTTEAIPPRSEWLNQNGKF